MAKQRMVNTRFWDDGYILTLTPNQRLLFLWAITNPATELCGAYEATLRKIEMQTGLRSKQIVEAFAKFEADRKIIYRREWVIVMNFTRHQNGTSTNIKKGAERTLSYCPDWVKDTLSTGIIPTLSATLPRPEPRPEPELSVVCVAPDLEAKRAEHLNSILDALRQRLNLNILRDEAGWMTNADWAFVNNFSAEQFMECYDLLTKQKWRKGRVNGQNVADNLENIEKLRLEIKEQDGSDKQRNSPGATDAEDGAFAIGLTEVRIMQ